MCALRVRPRDDGDGGNGTFRHRGLVWWDWVVVMVGADYWRARVGVRFGGDADVGVQSEGWRDEGCRDGDEEEGPQESVLTQSWLVILKPQRLPVWSPGLLDDGVGALCGLVVNSHGGRCGRYRGAMVVMVAMV